MHWKFIKYIVCLQDYSDKKYNIFDFNLIYLFEKFN